MYSEQELKKLQEIGEKIRNFNYEPYKNDLGELCKLHDEARECWRILTGSNKKLQF